MTSTPTTALAHLDGSWRSTAAAWLAEVGQRSGSQRTPMEYGRHLARFLELVDDVTQATPAHVRAFAYGEGPSGKKPAPATVIVRLAAVSGFYDFARRKGLVTANPAADVKRPLHREPTPRGLEVEEVRRLLDVLPDTPLGKRDRAIILTCVLTGLRRLEVMSLLAGDLTRNGTVFYTARVKGGTVRRRELPAPAFKAIQEALKAQGTPLDRLPAHERIFKLSPQGFYVNLGKYAREAGLGDVTPHVLRHSAAKLRRDSGASIEDVGSLLGHRSIATTARYLARLEGERDDGWERAAAALGVK